MATHAARSSCSIAAPLMSEDHTAELHAIFADLIAWDRYMGNWQHPTWVNARDLFRRLQMAENRDAATRIQADVDADQAAEAAAIEPNRRPKSP